MIVRFYYWLYCDIIGLGSPRGGFTFKSACRFFVRKTSNVMIRLHYNLTRWILRRKKTNQNTGERVIVSLTSFPKRIGMAWLAIESLLRQTYRPEKVLLWLSKEQFASFESLPKKLLDLQSYGLEIRMVDGDIRSHKKYQYVLREFPDDLVFLADDDIIYHPDVIKREYAEHCIHPSAIISNYSFGITYNEVGTRLGYNSWAVFCDYKYDDNGDTFFGSGGGTLVPPHSFYTDVINVEKTLELCPFADDVWLNAMCRLVDTPICKLEGNGLFLPVLIEGNEELHTVNVAQCQNDLQIDAVCKAYPEKALFTKQNRK